MTETDLKNRVRSAVRKIYPGVWIWKIADQWTHGIPDLLIIIEGVHIFIELKVPGNNPTPIQVYTIKTINEAGGHAFCCWSVEEVLECIKIASFGARNRADMDAVKVGHKSC